MERKRKIFIIALLIILIAGMSAASAANVTNDGNNNDQTEIKNVENNKISTMKTAEDKNITKKTGEKNLKTASTKTVTSSNYNQYFKTNNDTFIPSSTSQIQTGDTINLEGTFENQDFVVDKRITLTSKNRNALLKNCTVYVNGINSPGSTISNLTIRNTNSADKTGIFVNYSYNLIIENNDARIDDCTSSFAFAGSLNNSIIQSNYLETRSTNNDRTHTCCVLGKSFYNLITNNTVYSDEANGIYLSSYGSGRFIMAGDSSHNNITKNNVSGGNGMWVNLIQTSGTNNTIIDNTVNGGFEAVRVLSGDAIVRGNNITGAYSYGIYCGENAQVTNNYVETTANATGLLISSSNANIFNNTVIANKVAVSLLAAVEKDNITIRQNKILSHESNGIYANGMDTHITITDNNVTSLAEGILFKQQSTQKRANHILVDDNNITSAADYAINFKNAGASTAANVNVTVTDTNILTSNKGTGLHVAYLPPVNKNTIDPVGTRMEIEPIECRYNESITINATIITNDASTINDGEIVFTDNTGNTTASQIINNSASITTTYTNMNIQSITASYNGTENHTSCNKSVSIKVIDQTELSMDPVECNYNQNVTISASISAESNPSINEGTVTFTDNDGNVIGTSQISNNVAAITVKITNLKIKNITAAYSGTQKYSPSAKTVSVTVNLDMETALILIEQLKEENAILTNENTMLNSSVNNLTNEKNNLTLELNNKNALLTDAESQIDSLNESLNGNKTALQEAQHQIESLNSEINDMDTQLQDAQQEISNLTTALDNNQTALEQANSHIQQLNTSLQQAQNEIETLETNLNNNITALEESNNQINNLTARLNSTQSDLQEALAEINRLNDVINNDENTLKQQLNQAQQQAAQLNHTLQNVQEELSAANENITDLSEKLANNITALEEAQQNITQLTQSLNANATALSESLNEIRQLQDNLNSTNTQLIEAREEIMSLNNSLVTTQTALDNANNEIQLITASLNESENTLKNANNKISSLNANIESLQDALTKAQDDLKDIKAKYADSQKALNQSNVEKEKMQNSLESNKTALNQANKENSQLRSSINTKDAEITSLKNENAKLRKIVKKQECVTLLDAIPDIAYDDTIVISGQVRDMGDRPLGGVNVKITANNDTYTVRTNGSGFFTYSYTARGVYDVTVTAVFEGNDKYTPSTSTTMFSVNRKNSTVVINKIKSVKVDSTVTISGKLTSSDGKILANRNVKVKVNSKTYSVKSDKNGTFKCSMKAGTVGVNNVTVTYAGNSLYNGVANSSYFKVNKKNTVISVDEIAEVAYGDNVVIGGKLCDENGAAMKNVKVTIKVNNAQRTVKTDGNGIFKLSLKTTKVATNKLIISYAGATKYAASKIQKTFTVNKMKTNFTVNKIANTKKGSTVTVKGVYSDASGRKLKYTNVVVKVNSKKYTVMTNAKGVFSVKHKVTAKGTNKVNVSYAGNGNYLGSSISTTFKAS